MSTLQIRQTLSKLNSGLSHRKNYYIFFTPFGIAQASLALRSLIAKINPWQIIEGVNIKGAWNSDINFNKKFFKLENIFRKINSDLFFFKKRI